MIALSPAEWFALGFLAGVIASLCGWGSVVFWVDEIQTRRRRSDLTALADAVGVFETDDWVVCDDCRVLLDELNTAVTCEVHDLCADCDGHNNTSCNACRDARRLHRADVVFDWSLEGWVR